jgi:hypothetical protein
LQKNLLVLALSLMFLLPLLLLLLKAVADGFAAEGILNQMSSF